MTTTLSRRSSCFCVALLITFSGFANAAELSERRITYAVFKNGTRQPVEIRLLNSSGRYASFELGPGGVEGLPAQNGQAEVRTLDKRLLAKIGIDLSGQLYGRDSMRALYFRVQDHRITAISSKMAQSWNWKP